MAFLPLPAVASTAHIRHGGPRVFADDMPRGHASGLAPYRLLLVSSAATASGGVRTHELGLVGCVARAVAARTGHGADVDLASTARGGVVEVERLLRERDLARFDGLLLLLEPPSSKAALAAARMGLRRVLVEVAGRMPPCAPVTVALAPGVGPVARYGRAGVEDSPKTFRHIVAAACRPVAGFVELPDRRPLDPGGQYQAWGEAFAAHLARALPEPDRWRSRMDNLEEGSRQAAVDGLPLNEMEWEPEFQRILTFARAGYGTRYAAISLIDRGLTRYLVRRGFDTREMVRQETLCHTAVMSRGGLLVTNACHDARFRSCLPVREGSVGFYAGYRIEDAQGHPVAVLCVFDPEPRTTAGSDLTLLRDLALAAQRRLWELTQAASRQDDGAFRPRRAAQDVVTTLTTTHTGSGA